MYQRYKRNDYFPKEPYHEFKQRKKFQLTDNLYLRFRQHKCVRLSLQQNHLLQISIIV
jgi:hypothetical protein